MYTVIVIFERFYPFKTMDSSGLDPMPTDFQVNSAFFIFILFISFTFCEEYIQ